MDEYVAGPQVANVTRRSGLRRREPLTLRSIAIAVVVGSTWGGPIEAISPGTDPAVGSSRRVELPGGRQAARKDPT